MKHLSAAPRAFAAFTSLALLASSARAGDEPTFVADPEAQADSNEFVLDLRDDTTEADVAELAAKFSADIADNSPAIKDDGHIAVAHHLSAASLAALRSDPRVESVEPNALFAATFVPDDPKFQDQWHMSRVGAERAWELSCGRGVTVAVIDTGVACFDKGPFTKGTDLSGTRCVGGYNYVAKNTDAYDDHGHGTHVAGTIAQTTNNGIGVAGLADCANLMPIKVLSARGSGTSADVAEGIRFAADHGAQIINMSLGGPMRSSVIESAVKYVINKGVLVIAAAGNSGRSVGFPAAYDGVLAVSASDRNDNIAWFSSRGPQVGIAAPGVAVMQQTVCEGGKNKCEVFGVFNGTSMAAPHVAGAAAMVMGQGITEPGRVRELLGKTAVEKADRNLFGDGILRAGRAVWRGALERFTTRFALLLVLAGLASRALKKTGGSIRSKGVVLAALATSVGLLFFVPFVGGATVVPALRPAIDLLSRPVAEWDMLAGIEWHTYAVYLTGLVPVLGTMLFFGSKKLRPIVGGAALGTAALAASLVLSPDVAAFGGTTLLRVAMALTALVSYFLAKSNLSAKA
jgi:serine protease